MWRIPTLYFFNFIFLASLLEAVHRNP
jgi:hypothetical protein